ncbi:MULTISPECIES: hypothetical protein [unclassified Azospirillum]|uniref:hypothetical protein n=1 Tax=unclassified Azospirillum TaxID=2630922 RepID=UPI000B702F83|nr:MULTISPECIES: hypothetical protein [unclassified Azospirillum]SNS56780.1 hypothetical protein SAMN05880556_10799 [Azospirillum sp. RU38E]SNS76304.1 hypothetical protein SAMN05880591_10799 [Azospirillum sp. RU37A]
MAAHEMMGRAAATQRAPQPPLQTGEPARLPVLQSLLPWWRQLPRLEEGLPVWNGDLIAPLRPWLAHLLMVRFPRNGAMPRFTLYGSALTRFSGTDATGRDIDTGLMPAFEGAAASYLRTHGAARPNWSRVRVELPGGLGVRYSRLLLPFGCDDGDRRLLGIIHFDDPPPETAAGAPVRLLIEQEAMLVC